ncbi:BatA and WFA domain-containing protein, partial [bacterium]|nr:BatA and WFA domain-containing protein [bacterium]
MTFLNPLLLWGSLGAAFPLLLHLWGRRKPRRVPFPTLRFLLAGQQQQSRLARLRNLLLLLLRMLLIVLLSLALAQPIVRSSPLAKLFPAQRRVVIAVDTSASMAYRQGGETSMIRARRALESLLQQIPSTCEVQCAALDSDLRLLGPAVRGVRLAPLLLSELQPTASQGRLIEVLNRTREIALSDPQTRLFLVTDLQATNLSQELQQPLPLPPVVIEVGPQSPAPNHAITAVQTATPCPLPGRPVDLEVTLLGSDSSQGQGLQTLPLSLQAEGKPLPGKTVALGPGERRSTVRLATVDPGDLGVTVSLPPDGLALDDVAYHVIAVRERLRVGVVAGRSDPRYLSLALNPGGEADTGVEVSQYRWPLPADLPPMEVWVLADIPGQLPSSLVSPRGELRPGLILFAAPDTTLSSRTLRELLGAEVQLGKTVQAPPEEPLTLAEVDTLRRPLEPFANPRAGNLMDLPFRVRRDLPGAERARVLARFSDGSPAILGTLHSDRRVVLVNSSLDTRWTDAPTRPAYVPLVHYLCYDVAGPLRRCWSEATAGETLHVKVPTGATGPARVQRPDGQTDLVTVAEGQWQYTPPIPGLYRVTY